MNILSYMVSYPIKHNHLLPIHSHPIYFMANAIVSAIQICRCMGRLYHWINRRLFKTLQYLSDIISSTIQWCPVSITASEVANSSSLCSAACSSGYQCTHQSPILLAVYHGKLSVTSGFVWLKAGNVESVFHDITSLSSNMYRWWNTSNIRWLLHQMKTFSEFLALCVENPPVTGEFPAQRHVTRSFVVFFDLRINESLSEQSWG